MDPLIVKQSMTEGELGQAKLRVVLPGVIAVGYTAAVLFGVQDRLYQVLAFCALYALVGAVWLGVVVRQLVPEIPRRTAAVLVDNSLFALMFYLEPDALAPLCWIPLFSSLGHGLRFGAGMAGLAAVCGGAALLVGYFSSEFWRSASPLWTGILAAQLILPVYTTLLARSLQRERAAAKREVKELEAQRRLDPLTGAHNRLGFLAGVETALRSARTHGEGSTVFYIDLDGFKAVNDMFGHAAGDEVLRLVAKALRERVRGDDVVARLGGDEFGVVARGVNTQEIAVRLGREFLDAVQSVCLPGQPQVKVAASVGAAIVGSGVQFEVPEIVEIADRRMLRAKALGKAQVVVDTTM